MKRVYVDHVVDYLKRLSKFIDVRGAIYGSTARGGVYGRSDINLTVVSDHFDRPYHTMTLWRSGEEQGLLPKLVEALWVSPGELESMLKGFSGVNT
ncbi:MAG: hypothetical protein KIH01_05955 [Candidatus Freyarchaeota archaeon]|nr:hypothetical protein [Candidatus Jordarchaeia archaeon]